MMIKKKKKKNNQKNYERRGDRRFLIPFLKPEEFLNAAKKVNKAL